MKPPKSRKAELGSNATGGEKSHAETAESVEFKMTELGPIPNDWEVKRLGEVCALCNGYAFKSSSYINNGKYTVITIANVQDGIFSIDAANAVANLPRDIQRHQILEDGDILVSMTGNVGRTCRVSRKNCLLNQRVGKFDSIKIDRSFLYAVVQDKNFISAMVDKGQGGAQANISKHDIEEYLFPLPPLAEQRRIAGALSDVDELISALGKLIEKKRNIKTGAMQELLGMRNGECGMRNVPRRRLPGFSGEWVEKRLGDCGFCFNGITGKAGSDFGHGEAHYITFLNVLSNVVIDTEMLDAVDIKCGENQNEVKRGDLFFNTSSETAEEVGFCAVLDEEVTSVYLNSFCFGFRLTDDNVSGKFLAYWFRATGGRALMTFLAQGSTRYNLSKDAFREASISIPPTLAEQQAIAVVLSDIDAEIAALEADRAKYERIKSGMMQELLTGKTRLKGE